MRTGGVIKVCAWERDMMTSSLEFRGGIKNGIKLSPMANEEEKRGVKDIGRMVGDGENRFSV